jgi:hypothetical protein
MNAYLSRFSGLALSAIAMATLGGCALTTRNATLIYPPESSVPVVPVAQAATPNSNPVTIAVLPFVDRRPDPTKIGDVRNGLGMKMAPIRAANSVPVWVRDALALELRNAGYNADTSTPASDSSLVIGGEILNAHTDAYMSYRGEVDLLVHLTRGGRELMRQPYVGKGSGGANVGATSKSYAQALAMALGNALMQIVADVKRATTTQ